MENNAEILINSSHVTHFDYGSPYEFVLNDKLQVVECIRIDSLVHGIVSPIKDAAKALGGMLFELNHVRVNPRIDNTYIINCLTSALKNVGVQVFNTPDSNAMALCFKPLGEISNNVRFYLDNQAFAVFLSPAVKLRVISNSL